MRHMTMTVCSLMLLAAVQGTALADDMGEIPPPPTGGSCQAKVDECQNALTSCQEDVNDLLPIVATCKGWTLDETKKRLEEGTLTTTEPAKPKKPAKPKRPKTPKNPPQAVKGDPGPAGPQGPEGPQGPKGDDGDDGLNMVFDFVEDPKASLCLRGGYRIIAGLDRDRNGKLDPQEVERTSECHGMNGRDGKDGRSGRPGRDGNTLIQVGVGARAASIVSAGRPPGWSVAPELQLELWLSPTVEFTLGTAWAAGGDRNMVVTGQLCRRALNKRFGFCAGGQYHGWNLEGNLALWQSVLGIVSVKIVPIETRYVDVSFEAGAGAGGDGYDDEMQFAYGFTAQGTVTLKF